MKVEDEAFTAPRFLGHKNVQLQGIVMVPILVSAGILLLLLPRCSPPGQCEKSSHLQGRTLWEWTLLGTLLDRNSVAGQGLMVNCNISLD